MKCCKKVTNWLSDCSIIYLAFEQAQISSNLNDAHYKCIACHVYASDSLFYFNRNIWGHFEIQGHKCAFAWGLVLLSYWNIYWTVRVWPNSIERSIVRMSYHESSRLLIALNPSHLLSPLIKKSSQRKVLVYSFQTFFKIPELTELIYVCWNFSTDHSPHFGRMKSLQNQQIEYSKGSAYWHRLLRCFYVWGV